MIFHPGRDPATRAEEARNPRGALPCRSSQPLQREPRVAISDSELVRPDLPAVKHRWRWWRWALQAAGVLLLAAAIALWTLAANYRPVGFGGLTTGAQAGMPAGIGMRCRPTRTSSSRCRFASPGGCY